MGSAPAPRIEWPGRECDLLIRGFGAVEVADCKEQLIACADVDIRREECAERAVRVQPLHQRQNGRGERQERTVAQSAQERAEEAADEAGRVQAVGGIQPLLRQHQAHQGLGAGHEGAAALERPFVVEGNVVLRQRQGALGLRPVGLVDPGTAWRLAAADLQAQPFDAAERHQGAAVLVADPHRAATGGTEAAGRAQHPLADDIAGLHDVDDDEAEHGVAEELEPLVVIGTEAAVRECARQQTRLGEVVAQALQKYLKDEGILNTPHSAQHHFLVSDFTESFESSARMFFHESVKLEKHSLWN